MSGVKDLEPVDLNQEEKARLRECEDVIRRGLKTFVDVGRALREIRDNKLYRETHGTFEAYLKDNLDMARSSAYDFIHAQVVHKNLSGITDILPENVSQALPLAKLDPQAQRYVWLEAKKLANGKKITAEIVARAVASYLKEMNGETGGGKGGGSSSPIKTAITRIQQSLAALKDPFAQTRVLKRIYEVIEEELKKIEAENSKKNTNAGDLNTIDAEFEAS